MQKKGQRDKVVGGRLPSSLHLKAKHRALDEGISLQELIRRALEDYLDKAEKKRKPTR